MTPPTKYDQESTTPTPTTEPKGFTFLNSMRMVL